MTDGSNGNGPAPQKRIRNFSLANEPRDRRTLILACLLFWSVLAYILISRLAVTSAQVVGESMTPTLQPQDRRLLNRWAYRLSPPARGDIVAIALPWDHDLSVKRIIALPHERIQIRDGIVYVNDKPLAEPYLPPHRFTHAGNLSTHAYRIEPDSYFVMGDNRASSMDSRYFGAVHRRWIIGRLKRGAG